jgi:hypothetical protein
MRPELFAEVVLYETGGREGPMVGEGYKCPCKLQSADQKANDCKILLNGVPLWLGKPRKVGFVFSSPDTAAIFKAARKFYLCESEVIIGEAVVIPS